MLRHPASFAVVTTLFATMLVVRPGYAQGTAPPPTAVARSGPIRLESAVASMKRSHPLVLAARSRVHTMRAEAVNAGLWTNPILDAAHVRAMRNSSYDRYGATSFGVTQFLELSGAPSARRRAAQEEATATEWDVATLERRLRADLERAFIECAAAVQRKAIMQAFLEDLHRAEKIVTSRFSGGFAPRYDQSRISIALADAEAGLQSVEGDIARTRGALWTAIGPEATQLGDLPDFDFSRVPAVPALQAATTGLDDRLPQLIAARRRVRSADADVDAAERSVFPGIGVRVGGGYGQAPLQTDLSLGIIVPLPVLDRGQGRIPAARARVNETTWLASAIRAAAVQEISAIHAELIKRQSAYVQFLARSTTVSDSMRQEAEAGYREAKLSVFELIDAYQSLRDVKLRMVELSAALHVAHSELRRAAAL